jgi:hypothetical protein
MAFRRQRSPEREDHRSLAMAWRESREGSRDFGLSNGVHLTSSNCRRIPVQMVVPAAGLISR